MVNNIKNLLGSDFVAELEEVKNTIKKQSKFNAITEELTDIGESIVDNDIEIKALISIKSSEAPCSYQLSFSDARSDEVNIYLTSTEKENFSKLVLNLLKRHIKELEDKRKDLLKEIK